MTEELKQAAQQVLEAFDAFADADDFATLFDLIRKMNVLRDLTTSQPAQPVEREAWVPYLVDRADGVKGHYAIGRWNPRGYREVWNLHSHRWAAYSDDVMSLEEADSLLRQITIPTARASLPTQPAQATPEPVGEPAPGFIQLAETLRRIQRSARLSRDDQIAMSHAADTLATLQATCPAPGVPEGWHMDREGDDVIVVRHQAVGLARATNPATSMHGQILFALCDDILQDRKSLAAAQAKGTDHG